MAEKELPPIEEVELTLTPLKPVSEWVYDLFEVKYFDKEGGKLFKTDYIASSCTPHLELDVWENAPGNHCQWAEWEPIMRNVGHPPKIGSLYGLPISENSVAWGRALAKKLGKKLPY